MTREQRLVTAAFAVFVVVVVLALAGRVSATPPSHLGHISERLFADVSPTPRAAATSRAASSVGSVLGREDRRLPGASTPTAATPIPDPTDLSGDAAPSVGQPADRSAPRLALSGQATWYDDGPGLYAAVGSWRWGDDPYPVTVCTAIAGTSRCVTVHVLDYCFACRDGSPLIDLSPMAFRALGPLSAGVLRVSVSRP